MSKKLDEAWTTIYHYNDEIIHDMGSEYVENPLKEEIDIVNNALLELKAIKEANPSEALKCLKKLDNMQFSRSIDTYVPEIDSEISETQYLDNTIEFYIIKQALIKAQENEKVLSIIKEKKVIVDLLIGNNLERYNYEIIKFYGNYGWTKKCFLTEEEFDLLKRWLGNE